MKDISVEEMMVPLDEYATVTQDATLYESILALEKAQAAFNGTRYRHRAVLVLDNNRTVVGKLSQMDIIKALEPDFAKNLQHLNLSRFGIGDGYIEKMVEQYDFWNQPPEQLCKVAGLHKVSDVMYTPTEGEFIQSQASVQEAIHRLVIGEHHSLLVLKGEEIVGVLRLTDVFTLIGQVMKQVFAV